AHRPPLPLQNHPRLIRPRPDWIEPLRPSARRFARIQDEVTFFVPANVFIPDRARHQSNTSGLIAFSRLGLPSSTLRRLRTAVMAMRSTDSRVTPATCGATSTFGSL